MKTQNTTIENVQTGLILTFIPVIVAGIFSLIYGIINGDIDTGLLMVSAVLPVDRIKELLKSYKQPKTLLTDGATNNKIAKNHGRTFNLSLAPFTMNSRGINLCAKASKGCAIACIFDTGLGSVYQSIKKSRLFKSEYYVTNKTGFLSQLAKEIGNKIKNNKGSELFFRLNTFSDLDFVGILKNRELFDYTTTPENVYFYDYSAILGKAVKYFNDPKYTVTFSRKEDNENEVEIALQLGIPVAMVFAGEFPKYYKGVPVVDGDKTDVEMIKYKTGIVLGLKAKGTEAKKDKTGFVIQPETAKLYDDKNYIISNTAKQSVKLGSLRAFHNIKGNQLAYAIKG